MRLRPGNPEKGGVAVVGPGRVGQSLGKLLARAGIPILFVAARRLPAARRAARFIGRGRSLPLGDSRAYGSNARQLTEAPVVLLTTSDAALGGVARSLARLSNSASARRKRGSSDRARGSVWSGKVVLHTCGSLPSAVLEPLKRQGAAIGSLHPFQTIPSPEAGVRNLTGCFWGIEGDAAARKVAARLVRLLGGVAFPLRPERKILYHAAAFLVCPTIVTLMDRSARLLERSGVPARVAGPMLAKFVAETAGNWAQLGARRALTGPVARGDWLTIRRHLIALRRSLPDTVPLYIAVVRAMLRLARRRPPAGNKVWRLD